MGFRFSFGIFASLLVLWIAQAQQMQQRCYGPNVDENGPETRSGPYVYVTAAGETTLEPGYVMRFEYYAHRAATIELFIVRWVPPLQFFSWSVVKSWSINLQQGAHEVELVPADAAAFQVINKDRYGFQVGAGEVPFHGDIVSGFNSFEGSPDTVRTDNRLVFDQTSRTDMRFKIRLCLDLFPGGVVPPPTPPPVVTPPPATPPPIVITPPPTQIPSGGVVCNGPDPGSISQPTRRSSPYTYVSIDDSSRLTGGKLRYFEYYADETAQVEFMVVRPGSDERYLVLATRTQITVIGRNVFEVAGGIDVQSGHFVAFHVVNPGRCPFHGAIQSNFMAKEAENINVIDAAVISFGSRDIVPLRWQLRACVESGEIVVTPPPAVSCSAGKYIPEGENICQNCPRGFYQPEADQRLCIKCPGELITLFTGTIDLGGCVQAPLSLACPRGRFLSEGLCEDCPRGFFQPDDGHSESSCSPCPEGLTTLESGSSSQDECVFACGAGFFVSNGACQACPRGFYQPSSVNTENSCSQCPDGTTTDNAGSTSALQCLADVVTTCAAGSRILDNRCELCPLGFYSEGINSVSCTPCGDGSTTNAPGANSRDMCFPIGGDFGPRVCYGQDPALNKFANTMRTERNFFGYIDDQDGVTTYGNAYAWEYYAINTAPITFYLFRPLSIEGDRYTRFEVIRRWDATPPKTGFNEFRIQGEVPSQSRIGFSQTNVAEITVPYRSTVDPDGQYMSHEDWQWENNEQTILRVQYDSVDREYQFRMCMRSLPTVSSTAAPACPRGSFIASDNTCAQCDFGFYQPRDNQASCQRCPSGTTTRQLGSFLASDCVFTGICGRGRYIRDNVECVDCPRGTYQERDQQRSCQRCPTGLTTRGTGSQSISDCIFDGTCPAGRFIDDSLRCVDCPRGSYQPQSQQTSCRQCDPGLTTRDPGSTSSSDCVFGGTCPRGSYILNNRCELCSRGTYSEGENVVTCISCPQGTTTRAVGANSRSLCVDNAGPPGRVGPAGPPGVDGGPGQTGARGPVGPAGPTGPLGGQGVQGPPGLGGPSGPRGPTGDQGPDGGSGPRGPAGLAGIKGLSGPPGARGPQGDPGDLGLDGGPGLKGNKGEVGFAGGVGLPGPPGNLGIVGPPGTPGDDGNLGSIGPPGFRGEGGFTGSKGEVGDKGATGDIGPEGVPGPDGAPGPDGFQGPIGPPGAPGPSGSGQTLWSVWAVPLKCDIRDRQMLGDTSPLGWLSNDPAQMLPTGRVVAFSLYARVANVPVFLQVWRPSGNGQTAMLVAQVAYTPIIRGQQTFTLDNPISCRTGDRIGFYATQGVVPYDEALDSTTFAYYNGASPPSDGANIVLAAGGIRQYSLCPIVDADINECDTSVNNCDQGCENTLGSFRCTCGRGYSLNADARSCDDINECERNNGGCQHTCSNRVGSHECSCSPGYTLANDMRTCQDVNECAVGSANCAGECMNTIGSFMCGCTAGYSRAADGSCLNINECDTDVARCTGGCFDTEGSYTCTCQAGLELEANGKTCRDIDECARALSNCNAATQLCINSVGSYQCINRGGDFSLLTTPISGGLGGLTLPESKYGLLSEDLMLLYLIWLVILTLLLIAALIYMCCHAMRGHDKSEVIMPARASGPVPIIIQRSKSRDSTPERPTIIRRPTVIREPGTTVVVRERPTTIIQRRTLQPSCGRPKSCVVPAVIHKPALRAGYASYVSPVITSGVVGAAAHPGVMTTGPAIPVGGGMAGYKTMGYPVTGGVYAAPPVTRGTAVYQT